MYGIQLVILFQKMYRLLKFMRELMDYYNTVTNRFLTILDNICLIKLKLIYYYYIFYLDYSFYFTYKMSVYHNGTNYFLSDLIPEDVPLSNIYARIGGRLQYSNLYVRRYLLR